MDEEFKIGILTGTLGLLEMIIRELDHSGTVDKDKFAAKLKAMVKGGRENAPPLAGTRYDYLMAEKLAEFLSDPDRKGWTPVVIPGGKTDG